MIKIYLEEEDGTQIYLTDYASQPKQGRRSRGRTEYPDIQRFKEKVEILNLQNQGLTVEEIKEALGVSRQTIYNRLGRTIKDEALNQAVQKYLENLNG